MASLNILGIGDDEREPLGGAGVLQIREPDPAVTTPAQALGQLYTNVTDEIRRQRQISAERGLWDEQTGLPTAKGLLDVAKQYSDTMLLGTGAPGVRAYHASPHNFEKFSTKYIGTGEGNQAYGHGIYAAESPAVSGGGGQYDQQFTAKALGKYDLNQQEMSILRGLREGKSDLDILKQQWDMGATFDEANAVLDRMKAAKAKIYEVNIKAEPEQMLHWDKPLSQQSPQVQEALRKAWDTGDWGHPLPKDLQAATGEEFHNRLAQKILAETHMGRMPPQSYSAPVEAAKALQDAGIPGIRYLDQGSRNAGGWHITPPAQTISGKWMVKSSDYNSKGMHFDTEAEAQAALTEKLGSQTHNYVVFDDATIDILRKYGLAGLMLGGGAAAAAGNAQAKESRP